MVIRVVVATFGVGEMNFGTASLAVPQASLVHRVTIRTRRPQVTLTDVRNASSGAGAAALFGLD